MLSSILDTVPGVGHLKGVFHYMTGNFRRGTESIFEATRSGLVMIGGILGVTAGPMGPAAGAVIAGLIVDFLKSVFTGTPEGALAGINDIVNDLLAGQLLVESAVNLILNVLGDSVGGVGGANVNSIFKTLHKTVGKQILKTVANNKALSLLARSFLTYALSRATVLSNKQPQQHYRNLKSKNAESNNPKSESRNNKDSINQSNNKSKSLMKHGTNGSDSEPPDENQNNMKKDHCENTENTETHWDAFLKLFKATSLDDIYVGIPRTPIFKNLEDGQKKSLYKLISALRRKGHTYFSGVLHIVVEIFGRFYTKDTTFQNFLSLVQFVMTCISEEVAERIEKKEKVNQKPFEDRLKELTDEVVINNRNDVSDIRYKYLVLRKQIEEHWTQNTPTFRNLMSAIYHFYKHRLIPHQGRIQSVEEYFDLVQTMLLKLKTYSQFKELTKTRKTKIYEKYITKLFRIEFLQRKLKSILQFFGFVKTRREIKYEKYFEMYERRLRIVIKIQGEDIELSTCYFLDVHIEGDEESDEFIDDKKLGKIKRKYKKF